MKTWFPLVLVVILSSQAVLIGAGAPDAAGSAGARIFFRDVTATSGINYSNESWGAAWGDFNGDGLPDLYTSNHKQPDSLWLNNGDGTFTDIASQVDPIPDGYRDTHGSAWADVDNRGVMDLLQVTDSGSYWPSPDYFLHNAGGIFTDQAAARGLQFNYSRSRHPTWLDFNNDGRLDLFEPNLRRGDNTDLPSALFQQNADGTFTNVTTAVGCNCNPPLEYGQLADIAGNGNGRPQLLIASDLATGFPSNVYSTATVPFTDIRSQLGIPTIPHVFDSAIGDFTNSGRDDIFTVGGFDSNDALLYDANTVHARLEPSGNQTGYSFQSATDPTWQLFPGFLLLKLTMSKIYIGSAGYHPTVRSASKPVFTLSSTNSANYGIFPHKAGVDEGVYIGYDPATQTWSTFYSLKGRGVSVQADGGNYLTFITSATAPIANLNTINFVANTGYANHLLMNTGAGFTDATAAAGLTGSSFGSVVTGDFNNDGYLDIFAVGSRGAGELPNVLYLNNRNGTFTAIPNAGGALHTTAGHGDQVAMADYNNDGCLDLFETNGRKPKPFFGPYQLFQNACNYGRHWIELHLQGTTSNRDGVGAHVVVLAGQLHEMRDQDNGSHGRAQNSQVIHFGLGQNSTIASITIDWPSGIKQVLTNVAADQLMTVVEPAAAPGAVIVTDYHDKRPAAVSGESTNSPSKHVAVPPTVGVGINPADVQAAIAADEPGAPLDAPSVTTDPQGEVDVGLNLTRPISSRDLLALASREAFSAATAVLADRSTRGSVLVTVSEPVTGPDETDVLEGVIAVLVSPATVATWDLSSLQAELAAYPSSVLCASDAYLIQAPVWRALSAEDRGCLRNPDNSLDED